MYRPVLQLSVPNVSISQPSQVVSALKISPPSSQKVHCATGSTDASTAQPTPTQVITNVDATTQPQAPQLSIDDDIYRFMTLFND